MVGMVVVSQSRPIAQLALNITNDITYSILQEANSKLDSSMGIGMTARTEMCLMSLCLLKVLMVGTLGAALRYYYILFMAAFFPLALFLYFIPITKNYGVQIMKFAMLAVLVQIIQAVVYAAAITSSVTETGIVGLIIALGGVAGVAYAPFFGTKLMGWMGAVTHMYSTRGGGP